MEKNSVPFPQADNIDKLLKIININSPASLSDKTRMKVILGDITERQVQYYLNAVIYLDVINSKKEFTEFGMHIRNSNSVEQMILLSQKIVSKDVFGIVYFSELISGCKLTKEEIIAIMKKYVIFNSEQLYLRRAQTVISWIEWIHSIIE